MKEETTENKENGKKIDWHVYNLSKTKEKTLFYKLLHELCQMIPEPPHDNGRPPVPIRDLVFCACLKAYSNYSGRKVSPDLVQAQNLGYITKAPHFNTLTDFFNLKETIELLEKLVTISSLPLKHLEDSFSLDSSGFCTHVRSRYRYFKYGKYEDLEEKGWRLFVKGHLCIGTRTNVIVSVSVTPGNQADISEAPKLLKILRDNKFLVKEVSADKAYSSKRVRQLIESMGAMGYIPYKENSVMDDKAPKIWNKMYLYFLHNYDIFIQHYHKRSNIETVFMMIKLKFGEHLRCKKFVSQSCELLLKFICHNLCCLIAEIFENDVHVDFRKSIEEILDREVREREKSDPANKP